MDKKQKVTEQLKVLEDKFNDNHIDLRSIRTKLSGANAYQDELLVRLEKNRNKIEALQKEFFIKAGSISGIFSEMKEKLYIWTRFYNY